jgi:acetylcholinesterase
MPLYTKHLSLIPLLSLALAAPTTTTPPPPTATIASGVLVGTQTTLPGASDAPVNKFLGVPYAAPPVRFSLATPPDPWTTPRDASQYGGVCPQNYVLGSLAPDPEFFKHLFYTDIGAETEDCLKLNVYAPATPPDGASRPVLVFIPGGGFQIGHGNSDLSSFAAYEDVVAVGFNYRINVLGFPSSSEIPLEERNLGLRDQRLALAWVQENIASFNGDPSRVTIWGQSAGSMSIDMHLRAFSDEDSSSRPFDAAILSSGQVSFGMQAFTRPSNDTSLWDALASIVGCADAKDGVLECIRHLPLQTLLDAMLQYEISFGPVIDGVTNPAGPAGAWHEGKTANVPMLTGTVAEEGRSLVNANVNKTDFIGAYFPMPPWTPDQVESVFDFYAAQPGIESEFDVAAAISTDYLWTCPQGMLANASTAAGRPTYRYIFNATVDELLPTDADYSWLGAFHGAEIMLLLANETDTVSGTPLPAETITLKRFMTHAIGEFVKDPDSGPGWATVGSTINDIAVLGDTPTTQGGSGATMLSAAEVDAKCVLFADALAILELVTG